MEFITQNVMLVTLFVVSGAVLAWNLTGGAGRGQVGPAEATRLINHEDAVIIDVRDASEFATGHLPEALNIPLDKLAERIGEIEKFKERTVLVCCAAGMRSNKGCGELAKQGFAKSVSLAGGIDAWLAAGYPLKKSGRAK